MPWIIARAHGEVFVGQRETLTTNRLAARAFAGKSEALDYLRACGADAFHGAYLPVQIPGDDPAPTKPPRKRRGKK